MKEQERIFCLIKTNKCLSFPARRCKKLSQFIKILMRHILSTVYFIFSLLGLTLEFYKHIFLVCSFCRLKLYFMSETDQIWMQKAIEAAEMAALIDEVPVGACIIDRDANILALAGNRTIIDNDPTAHAEILVLREAARKINNYRLTGTIVYTTIEPCAMCAGALINARVKRLVFGAHDKRFGAVESVFQLCNTSSLNHKIEITSGVSADKCRKLMQDFFRLKRLKIKKPIEI